MQNDNDQILAELKKHFSNQVELPEGISFIKNEDSVTIVLYIENILKANMQTNSNAFEGFALAIRAALNCNISLDISYENVPYDSLPYEHLKRFYYRVLKFKECFDWFSVSPKVDKKLGYFLRFINDVSLINNFPTREAKTNPNKMKENFIESKLCDALLKKDYLGDIKLKNKIYRQLPVGLYIGTVAKANKFFTDGKSAVDLWTYDDDNFILFELKTNNSMIGIVTEVFFYSNFMRDLLLDDGYFKINHECKKFYRGYDIIDKNHFTKVTGVMIADTFHPLVTDEIVDILNENKLGITFKKVTYNYDELLK